MWFGATLTTPEEVDSSVRNYMSSPWQRVPRYAHVRQPVRETTFVPQTRRYMRSRRRRQVVMWYGGSEEGGVCKVGGWGKARGAAVRVRVCVCVTVVAAAACLLGQNRCCRAAVQPPAPQGSGGMGW